MKEKKRKDNLEEEVWNAISAFEQILEAIPNDRASLDALSHAYGQIGDQTRAMDYLVRLGDVLVEEGDVEAARELLEKIKAGAEDDERARGLVVRIESMVQLSRVVPTLFDRREARAYLATDDGGYRLAGAPLDLPRSTLHMEPGPPGLEIIALTDAGLSRLRFEPSGAFGAGAGRAPHRPPLPAGGITEIPRGILELALEREHKRYELRPWNALPEASLPLLQGCADLSRSMAGA